MEQNLILAQLTGTVICLLCLKFESYMVVEEFRCTQVVTLLEKESNAEGAYSYCQTCNLI